MAGTSQPIAPAHLQDAPSSHTELDSPSDTKDGGEDQALESHEVIELQTFSERKAWIEEKIKFLESLPPINVFHGLDYIRASAEEVPGLPTRQELQAMVMEHDAIEKETEIFDTGELTKLRQLTKAATQRNLSPADTDLIELTLTTIYELDKLLHLLRDRSDNLEMMAIRLTWEEHRRTAWRERRHIIERLNSFAVNRARWSPTIYDLSQTSEESSEAPTRRGSVASMASTRSSDSAINSSAFSRSARFKLAELLSRDAAQFTGRATSLKLGTVTTAGKALDRLIDRKTVPEALLDEQDRLEDKCIAELENVGKFTLSLVMQWRKADEIYVETMKDHNSSSNLLEEIETAQNYHPTARQSASFISRIDTILKRLAVRGDPASPVSLFPRPEHPLFPDQKEASALLVQRLSVDINATATLACKVELAAKSYKSRYEAVKSIESLLHSIGNEFSTLTAITKKFREGISSDDGDGSPPDLTLEDSLEPMSHNVFLALFPSLLEETNLAIENAGGFLHSAPSVLSGLDLPGIDDEFKENAITSVRSLSSLMDEACRLRDSVVQQVARLRESRKIASTIDSKLGTLKTVRMEIVRAMELNRWYQESGGTGAPPTPESPLAELHKPITAPLSFDDQLAKVKSSLVPDIEAPLDRLFANLERQLQFVLKQRFSNLQFAVDASYQMLRLLGSIEEQTLTVISVRDSFQKLSIKIEEANVHCSNFIRIAGCDSDESSEAFNMETLDLIQKEVAAFVDELFDRVPFIARQSRLNKRASLMLPVSPVFKDLNDLVDIWTEIPFDLASVDTGVRADCNMYSMRLSGDLDKLLQTKGHLDLMKKAKQFDESLSMTSFDINGVVQQLSAHKSTFISLQRHSPEAVSTLQTLLNGLDSSKAGRPSIARSLSPIRDLLRQMEEISRPLSPSIRDPIYQSRVNTADEAEIRLNSWYDQVYVLKQEVSLALEDEHKYQDECRLASERRNKEEQERIAAQEIERERLEKDRLEAEERQRRLQELRAEEKRREEERNRLAAELAEKNRLEREAAEAERLRLEEQARLDKAARLKFEEERLAREAEERGNQEKERRAMLEKLRLTEEELDQERKVHAHDTKIAKELAAQQKKELEKLEQRQIVLERAAQERIAKEQSEKGNNERLQQDRMHSDRDKAERTAKKGKGKEIRLEPLVHDSEDVFIVQSSSSQIGPSLLQGVRDLQGQIIQLRKRLKSLCMNEAIRPSKTSTELPTEEQAESIVQNFTEILDITQTLPSKVDDPPTYHELQCLRNEVEESSRLIEDLQRLVLMQQVVQACDGALSDLLEHIDSYPAPPLGLLSSSHKSQPSAPPEEQFSARLAFTRKAVSNVTWKLKAVSKDPRANAENDRIQQTWSELNDMAIDRLVGKKSRSPSVVSGQSSGGNSSASSNLSNHTHGRKAGSYSNLSVSSVALPPRPKMLAPPPQHAPRRAVSGSRETASRSASRLSTIVPHRSVSGPKRNSVHEPTFASRQRTTSLSNSTSTAPLRNPVALAPAIRLRCDSIAKRSDSPATPDYQRSQSRTFNRTAQTPRSSMNSSTWSKAPRNSLSSIIQRNITPKKKGAQPAPRKKYIADPKSKLDMAVGDVVNKLSVGINVEGVTESWRDQSGKYWIGNEEAKLCFCRILRSQTVMVRVGGGWTELSKFIKNHFADTFRLLPESPSRPGSREPKWISSATLMEGCESPPAAPRTPEPSVPFVPTFSLMTPSGQSPRSIKSSPSTKGSPLTPLQFMRRAEPDLSISMFRPITPSKSPRNKLLSTPNTPVWRP